jgi:signal transduction histidine kinase
MLLSLRTRLWLSYALLIGILLGVVALALALALLRNPAVYRGVLPSLRAVVTDMMPDVRAGSRDGEDRLQALLEERAQAHPGYRVAVLDDQGRVVADSMRGKAGALPQFDPENYPHRLDLSRPALVRDARRRFWVYWTAEIGRGSVLFVGTNIPRLPVAQLLRNDVAAPLIYAGLIAFMVSTLLAIGMGRWITAPLERMVAASREMAAGKNISIPEEGPGEVRQLARAMNAMHRQAQVSLQTQRDVLHSQRDFIANVSHELRTPLTSIQGFAQAILDGAAQTPEALKTAGEVIYQESTRMARLVQELLTLARLDAGTADLRRDVVDLRALLAGVAAKFEPQAKAARVGLEFQSGDLPAVTGDGDRLAQVFTNLVDNALKFTPPDGKVGIHAAAVDNGVLVEVWDSGKGIPEQDRERVFERFYQVEKSRRGGSERGLGLGLPIAREIVQAHGGRIWMEGALQGTSRSRAMVLLPVPAAEGKERLAR